MKVFDIETALNCGQVHSVVADSVAEAERVFVGKYWPTEIKKITLHSEYVQIQKYDEKPKKCK